MQIFPPTLWDTYLEEQEEYRKESESRRINAGRYFSLPSLGWLQKTLFKSNWWQNQIIEGQIKFCWIPCCVSRYRMPICKQSILFTLWDWNLFHVTIFELCRFQSFSWVLHQQSLLGVQKWHTYFPRSRYIRQQGYMLCMYNFLQTELKYPCAAQYFTQRKTIHLMININFDLHWPSFRWSFRESFEVLKLIQKLTWSHNLRGCADVALI